MKYKKLLLNGPKILILFILLIPVFVVDGILSIFAYVVLWPFEKLREIIETILTKLINSIE